MGKYDQIKLYHGSKFCSDTSSSKNYKCYTLTRTSSFKKIPMHLLNSLMHIFLPSSLRDFIVFFLILKFFK